LMVVCGVVNMIYIERCIMACAPAILRVVGIDTSAAEHVSLLKRLHKIDDGRRLLRKAYEEIEETREYNLVSRHLGEGLVQLVRDGLELLLLVDQFIFEPVDFLLQLLY